MASGTSDDGRRPSGEVGMTAQPLIADAPVGAAPEAAPQSSGAVPPAVRVQGVSQVFTRGAPPVLQGVDLTVAPGEFVCLLGASGCGKSTLLNLIAGLSEPTAGSIEVSVQRPALMFQEPALLPWLTAAGNVELALKARGVGRSALAPRGGAGPGPREGGGAAPAPPAGPRRNDCSGWSTSPARRTSACTSCPAACASGWHWPARWPRTARSC